MFYNSCIWLSSGIICARVCSSCFDMHQTVKIELENHAMDWIQVDFLFYLHWTYTCIFVNYNEFCSSCNDLLEIKKYVWMTYAHQYVCCLTSSFFCTKTKLFFLYFTSSVNWADYREDWKPDSYGYYLLSSDKKPNVSISAVMLLSSRIDLVSLLLSACKGSTCMYSSISREGHIVLGSSDFGHRTADFENLKQAYPRHSCRNENDVAMPHRRSELMSIP